MPISDGLWLLEASLNYTFCGRYLNEPQPFAYFRDSIKLKINLTDTSINYSELTNLCSYLSKFYNDK